MNEYFYCMQNFPDMDDRYIQEGLSTTFQEQFKPHLFKSTGSSFEQSDFVCRLRAKFNQVTCMWLLNPPWSINDWHKDMRGRDGVLYGRNVSINIPIKVPKEAATYMREPYHLDNPSIYWKIIPVKYIKHKPTVLNVQAEHCVLNPSDETRIIMSINIENSAVLYKDVVAEVAQW